MGSKAETSKNRRARGRTRTKRNGKGKHRLRREMEEKRRVEMKIGQNRSDKGGNERIFVKIYLPKWYYTGFRVTIVSNIAVPLIQ